jgi:hypothetical protein
VSGSLSRLLPLAALALAAAAPGRAAVGLPAAVLSSDSAHYRQALEGFVEAWGGAVPVVAADAPLPAGTWAFVAVGTRAAARRWPKDSVVVACLAPGIESAEDDPVTRVSLLPDPDVLVKSMRALVPALKVLRVFWSSDGSREDVESLEAAGERAGIVVLSERVFPPSRLPERLRSLDGKADALWLMPDPALVNAENFSILREYAAAQKLPFLAPTEGLAERGATATISVSFRDMGRAAALTLRSRLEGRAGPEISRAGRVAVTVNAPAARAAGLGPKFDSADKIIP